MMDQTTVIHINHMYLVNLPYSGHQAAGAWQTHVKPPLTDTGRGEQEMFHLFMPCAPKPNYMGSFLVTFLFCVVSRGTNLWWADILYEKLIWMTILSSIQQYQQQETLAQCGPNIRCML